MTTGHPVLGIFSVILVVSCIKTKCQLLQSKRCLQASGGGSNGILLQIFRKF